MRVLLATGSGPDLTGPSLSVQLPAHCGAIMTTLEATPLDHGQRKGRGQVTCTILDILDVVRCRIFTSHAHLREAHCETVDTID